MPEYIFQNNEFIILPRPVVMDISQRSLGLLMSRFFVHVFLCFSPYEVWRANTPAWTVLFPAKGHFMVNLTVAAIVILLLNIY